MPRKINEDKIERDKKLLMSAGIVFFMSLIVVLWGFNMKAGIENTFQSREDQSENNFSLTDNLSFFMEDTTQEIENLEQQVKGFKTTNVSSSEQRSFLENLSLQYNLILEEESQEFVANLRQELETKLKP